MKQALLIICVIVFSSCNRAKNTGVAKTEMPGKYDSLEELYYMCDTIIRRPDTLIIVNSRLDTTITETGIFTYLQYDYPLSTPQKLIELSKAAFQPGNTADGAKADEFCKKIIDFYANERPEQLKEFSDMNAYLQYEVNAAILCSYAYEKLGDTENALKTLQPFLANVEASRSRIHERYIKLCVKKYGIVKVRSELNTCGNTIQFKKQASPDKDDWVVSVFGADIGVGNASVYPNITKEQADTLIRQMYFSKLLQ